MIGAIIGDVVGSQFEFINYTSKNQMFKDYKFEYFTDKCKPTDDTVLSIAVAESLLNNDSDNLAKSLKDYGRKYPNAGYGGSFLNWLSSEGHEPYNSYGNGSAMRVSSVGWLYDTKEDVMKYAEITANPTHNHPEGVKGAQAIAMAIFLARNKKSKTIIKNTIQNLFDYNLDRTLDEIRPTYEFSATCQLTVPEAIIAFLESENFEDCLRRAISIGGDSDTIACMACSIAEAYYGIENIPLNLIEGTMYILQSYHPELHEKANNFINSIYDRHYKADSCN